MIHRLSGWKQIIVRTIILIAPIKLLVPTDLNSTIDTECRLSAGFHGCQMGRSVCSSPTERTIANSSRVWFNLYQKFELRPIVISCSGNIYYDSAVVPYGQLRRRPTGRLIRRHMRLVPAHSAAFPVSSQTGRRTWLIGCQTVVWHNQWRGKLWVPAHQSNDT